MGEPCGKDAGAIAGDRIGYSPAVKLASGGMHDLGDSCRWSSRECRSVAGHQGCVTQHVGLAEDRPTRAVASIPSKAMQVNSAASIPQQIVGCRFPAASHV